VSRPPTYLATDGAAPGHEALDTERRIALHLPGLGCRACARRAEDVLRRIPGVVAARVRLFRERADVRFDARSTSEDDLTAVVGRAGFTVGAVECGPSGGPLGVGVGIGLAALANLLFLEGAAPGDWRVGIARLVLALVALTFAGGPPARRAIGLLRGGILDRDALPGVAAIVCFAAGMLELALASGSRGPASWLTALGAATAVWPEPHGAGFVAAAAIAVAARLARGAEAALHRVARRDLEAREERRSRAVRCLDASGDLHPVAASAIGAGDRILLTEGDEAPADLELEAPARVVLRTANGHLAEVRRAGEVMPGGAALLSGEVIGRVVSVRRDPAAALDLAVRASLARLFATGQQSASDPWEDAATRGLLTAALGCAAFALVTHGWLGAGPLGPLALSSTAAVLVVVSPSSILVAAPAARAIALLRACAAGALLRDPGALDSLARVDTVCFEKTGPLTRSAGAALQRLRARGIRALVLGGQHPAVKATAIRDLQRAGARVALVGEGGGDPGVSEQADVAVAVGSDGAGAIVLPEGGIEELAGLVDLGRGVRFAIRGSVALGAVYNAVLLPAAALGWLTPLRAAALVLLETLVGLAAAALLLYRAR